MSSPAPHYGPYHFARLLVGDRWEQDVRLEVAENGRIHRLEADSAAKGCELVPGWTVPGVPNVHSHSFQRALAGLAEGSGPDSFWSWREVMYAFLEQLTPDAAEAVAAQLYLEMLKAGFTCVGEFHYVHHAPDGRSYDDPAEMSRRIIAAARETGIGLVHMPVVYEAGGFGGKPLEEGQRRFRLDLEGAARLHEAVSGESSQAGIRLGRALHSLRAVSSETFGRLEEFLPGGADSGREPVGRAAGPAPAPMHIHVAERKREVRECVARRGVRPIAWLLDHAPVDERWCLVHATHANSEELDGIAARGAVVGLCPTTEANLGDGLFPLGAFAARGGRFGIGTDSHVSRSPVDELRLLDYGQRLVSGRRSGVQRPSTASPGKATALSGAGGALLANAWQGGCGALAWSGGRIEPGRRADLVVLDADHPALVGRGEHTVLDSWIFSGTESPVQHVMVGGDWVVRDGHHRYEEEIGRAFAKGVKQLTGIAAAKQRAGTRPEGR